MRIAALLASTFIFCGCDNDPVDPPSMVDPQPDTDPQPGADPQPDTDPQPDADPQPEAEPAPNQWRCTYINPFAQSTDCKQYTGAGWTAATREADCAAVFGNTAGELVQGACGFDAELGRCAVGEADGEGYMLVSEGADVGACGLAQNACETFAMGSFELGNTCQSDDACDPGEATGPGFQGPRLECRPPMDGEPAGSGPNGEVCTWSHIGGSTEEGRHYADYGDCSHVLSQGRPYFAIPNPIETPADDPRLSDADWMAEATWVTKQIEASACVCCHSDSRTPNGYSVWDTESGPLWFDQFSKPGLAMMAGLVSSESFGAFDPDENNGFDRSITGAPTTNVERMQAFFQAEFDRRGGTEDDVRAYADFGGPLAAQLVYEPEECEPGVGVMADGTLMWTGGGARYVYVIAEGGANVGVPPNLDLPEDTLWNVSIPPEGNPIGCGGQYGVVPEGAVQRVPADGEAPTLVPGQRYYFVVLRDIILPLQRCIFTYEGE